MYLYLGDKKKFNLNFSLVLIYEKIIIEKKSQTIYEIMRVKAFYFNSDDQMYIEKKIWKKMFSYSIMIFSSASISVDLRS